MSEEIVPSNEMDNVPAEEECQLKNPVSVSPEAIDALQNADGSWSIENLENLSANASQAGQSTQTDDPGTLENDYSFAHHTSHTMLGFLCFLYFVTLFVLFVLAMHDAYQYEFDRAHYSSMYGVFFIVPIVLGYVCQIYNIVVNKKDIRSFSKMDCIFGIIMIIMPILLFLASVMYDGQCDYECKHKQGFLNEDYKPAFFDGIEFGLLPCLFYLLNIPITASCIGTAIRIKEKNNKTDKVPSLINQDLFIRCVPLILIFLLIFILIV